MDETDLFNELWEDDTPRENCVFPTRGMLQLSDMYNPRWPGACCDATAMLLTIKANFFAKEYNRPITNVGRESSQCIATNAETKNQKQE